MLERHVEYINQHNMMDYDNYGCVNITVDIRELDMIFCRILNCGCGRVLVAIALRLLRLDTANVTTKMLQLHLMI